ncbi:cytochrome b/b6 domain-containing protein [Celerinatantimonas sp. MCCC 1A17872]|uniref:cytochrome b/b6 domain-containing protein n=1 Tax=Celerinatantimonas sp. MCCC 1A17872 TaxID=3177514 RepID=UPI0038C726D7
MSKATHWDIIVKLTHWSVALGFLINYFVTDAGSQVHQWVGYSVVAVVVIRLLWGLIAKPPARLSSFLPNIPNAFTHIIKVTTTREDHHQGHNPAGAIMIWCMWSGLLLIGLSGYMMETDYFWDQGWLRMVHVGAVNVTLCCVCIHIASVIIMGRITGRSYIKEMLPSPKKIRHLRRARHITPTNKS